jgi:hypothetical protein
MSETDNDQTVAAAVATQVKLCTYDEEEPAIWFRLIEAKFAVAGIKLQKLRYANALASLPEQVLPDIFDTVDICNESDKPFDLLKDVLLGQFRKSKKQLYFELLWLPIKMRVLQPSILVGNSNSSSPMASAPTHTFSSPCS